MTVVEGQVALVALGMMILVLLASVFGRHWAARYEQREAAAAKPIAQEVDAGSPPEIVPTLRQLSGSLQHEEMSPTL